MIKRNWSGIDMRDLCNIVRTNGIGDALIYNFCDPHINVYKQWKSETFKNSLPRLQSQSAFFTSLSTLNPEKEMKIYHSRDRDSMIWVPILGWDAFI